MRLLKRTFEFLEDEYRALVKMSMQDFRTVQGQLHWLIRQEAARRGLLETTKECVYEAKQAVD